MIRGRGGDKTEVKVKVVSAALHNLCAPFCSPGDTITSIPVGMLQAAHSLSLQKVRLLASLLSRSKGNGLCLPLHTSMSTAYALSVLVDAQFGTGRTDHSRLEEVVTVLQDVFSKSLNDRTEMTDNRISGEGSKKVLVLRTVNLLFKSYFKLNTLRLCKNISRPVEAKGLSTALPLGGMGEILTYQYYTGRVAMFEDNYEGAEKALMKAYKGAPKGCEKNKRMCLGYLIPVRMIRGCLPTEELLVKYGLKNVYWDIVEGMRTGNIRMFMQGLNNNQRLFISKGTYLLLEKCKVLAYRNLFKRTQGILGTTQLPLDKISRSFGAVGVEVDQDEVECIIANLIFKGFVRGYISHEKKTVVVSKKEAFPKAAFKR